MVARSFDSRDDIALSKLVQIMPPILGLSSDNTEQKLDWLQQNLSLTDDELSKMIQRCPTILGLNIDSNLEPKLAFYIDALGDENEAISFVIKNPFSFGFSLEKRLKPRLEQAFDAGMVVDYKLLRLIMKCTNDKWNRKVEIEMGKG